MALFFGLVARDLVGLALSAVLLLAEDRVFLVGDLSLEAEVTVAVFFTFIGYLDAADPGLTLFEVTVDDLVALIGCLAGSFLETADLVALTFRSPVADNFLTDLVVFGWEGTFKKD